MNEKSFSQQNNSESNFYYRAMFVLKDRVRFVNKTLGKACHNTELLYYYTKHERGCFFVVYGLSPNDHVQKRIEGILTEHKPLQDSEIKSLQAAYIKHKLKRN